MRRIISNETKLRVKELLTDHSVSEIATLTGLCRRSIFNIQKELNITRSPEQIREIRSRIRSQLVQAEKRRVLFGINQKTNLKVYSNKKRIHLKYKMRKLGYETGEDPNTMYFTDKTCRHLKYENTAGSLGLQIKKA